MPIPIPYARSYTVEATGGEWRAVDCEHCGCKFNYYRTLQASTSQTDWLFLTGWETQEAAREEASRKLAHKSRTTSDFVACPECGRFQSSMRAHFKRDQRNKALAVLLVLALMGVWLTGVDGLRTLSGLIGIGLFIAFLTLKADFPIFSRGTLFVIVVGIAVAEAVLRTGGIALSITQIALIGALLYFLWGYRRDLNADPETNKRRLLEGKYPILLRQDFEEMVDRGQEPFRKQ
jgi:hypothetical protein